jgi:hypothetical protein
VERCSKCNMQEVVSKYTDLKQTWGLCYFCNSVFANQHYLLLEFLKDDFGGFPMSSVNKKIINARINRAKGERQWPKASE